MTLDEIRWLPMDEVVALLAICRKGMRFQDGFWFMNVEDTWGLERAVEIDADVWSRFGSYEAGLLVRAFGWKEQGIPKLVKALRYAPSWLFFEYSVEQISETEALFRVQKCLAQVGRLRAGRGVFSCRSVEEGYLSSFAEAIGAIKVEHEFGPPDTYAETLWCGWRFRLDRSQ
ncbi:MAG: DUF6125 family protein [candidate division WOR-3 bacterium]